MRSSFPRRTVIAATAATVIGGGAPAAAAATRGDLSLPDTRVARAAAQLVARTQKPYLRNHSLRSYLFSQAVAARTGQDYDDEVLFLICALHDMGATSLANTGQRFEVDGADFAARFLERNGITDSRVDTVWDGIAWHTSSGFSGSPVFRRRRRPEIGLAHAGIGIDVLGGPDDLPAGYAERVLAVYPRLDGIRALTQDLLKQAVADPRKAPPLTFPGEILHQLRPDLPYATWDMLLAASGWHD
ncbi:HD domain-containing protein [Kibdelosporangium phytohabitans]|uniref:HD domain-containing protein n=1 Tax=Kibdelosporangium phytohabitans TaxID=860235 RepID=A0A0N9I945_9PSEU|nr:HD domain-containing protein [Kibdelosporangium phytohabitans]ALG11170.1 hypothetical protein AOZ06_33645 [Kibdelosporangium phytohabitans]MBE1462429.1 hypothetical protein [Kibdelosporangium phytohabitans]